VLPVLPIAVVGVPRCAQTRCASEFNGVFVRVFECEFDVVCRRRVKYVSFGQGSSLLWTNTLRPFYSRPIALTQEESG